MYNKSKISKIIFDSIGIYLAIFFILSIIVGFINIYIAIHSYEILSYILEVAAFGLAVFINNRFNISFKLYNNFLYFGYIFYQLYFSMNLYNLIDMKIIPSKLEETIKILLMIGVILIINLDKEQWKKIYNWILDLINKNRKKEVLIANNTYLIYEENNDDNKNEENIKEEIEEGNIEENNSDNNINEESLKVDSSKIINIVNKLKKKN